MNTTLPRGLFKDGFNNPIMSDLILQLCPSKEDINGTKKRKLSTDEPNVTTEIYVSKLFLFSQSKFFATMLSNGMKETNQSKVQIFLEPEKHTSFKELIRFLYTGTFDDKSPETLCTILILADQYDLPDAAQYAAEILQKSEMNYKSCGKYLRFLNTIQMSDIFKHLYNGCASFLEEKFEIFDDAWRNDEFYKLNHFQVEILIKSDKIKVFSENTMYLAVRSWCDGFVNRPVKASHAKHKKSLIKSIRYHHMTTQYLFYLLQTENDLKNDPWFQSTIANALVYKQLKGEAKETCQKILNLPPPRPPNVERETLVMEMTATIGNEKPQRSEWYFLHGFPVFLSVEHVQDDCIGFLVYRQKNLPMLDISRKYFLKSQITGQFEMLMEKTRHYSKFDKSPAWGLAVKKQQENPYTGKDSTVTVRVEVKLLDS